MTLSAATKLYIRRVRVGTGLSILVHALVLGGGFGLLYEDALYGVSAGGGQVQADLVKWSEVSELTVFKPVAEPPKDAFVIPKEKPEPAKVVTPEMQQAPVEGKGGGSAGPGEVTRQAGYFVNPLPPYPRDLRSQGIEGELLLLVHVDDRGRVQEVEILKASGYSAFDQSAKETVLKRWRFRPARIGSLRVASKVKVPVRFEIKGR